jgi:hypothetical protein
MAGIINSLTLDVGELSWNKTLGRYYQDISDAVAHITNGVFAALDDDGIPYCIYGDRKSYAPIITIQYALANFDLMLKNIEPELSKKRFLNCVTWLEQKSEPFQDGIVLRNSANEQYNLPEGWVSGMAQGQLISVFLRAYQLMNDEKYLHLAQKTFNIFKYDYAEGGFKRIDKYGCIWFEEYPSATPSYVLNGFVFTMLGVLDLFRVTGNPEVKELWDKCVNTLEINLSKYDVWYWSVYDQLKVELVSYYYQKNVHVPLMKIMFGLTKKEIFNHYAVKWERNLNNRFHRFVTQIMYRVLPRIQRLKKRK